MPQPLPPASPKPFTHPTLFPFSRPFPQYPHFGWTAADVASSRGHASALALLLDAGALGPEPSGEHAGEWPWGGADANALHLAVAGGHGECVGLLLRRFAAAPEDADVRAWAERFCNAQNKAREKSPLPPTLVHHCMATHAPTTRSRPPSLPDSHTCTQPVPVLHPQEGLTPLQAAVRKRRPDMVRLLVACPCVRLADRAREGPSAAPGSPARLSAYMLAALSGERALVEALCSSGRMSSDGYALEEEEEEPVTTAPAPEGGDAMDSDGHDADPMALGPHCTVRRIPGSAAERPAAVRSPFPRVCFSFSARAH